eukprot:scaffold5856_cov14-Tisochrysis_lutea.AAC.2
MHKCAGVNRVKVSICDPKRLFGLLAVPGEQKVPVGSNTRGNSFVCPSGQASRLQLGVVY